MAPRSTVVFAVILTVFCCGSCLAVGPSCAPGAFLATKAQSVDALAQQVVNNRTVAQRYSKFYQLTPREIAGYLRSNAKVTTLRKPLKTTVYYIGRKSGKIYSRTRVLRPGTMVFALRDGTPLMDVKCGNPFRKITIPPVRKPPVEKEKSVTQEIKPTPKPEAFVPPPPPVEAPAVTVAPPPVEPPPPAAPTPRPRVPLVAKVAPALLAAGFVRNSSGGAVPEPGTIIAALSVLIPAGVIFRRRRK